MDDPVFYFEDATVTVAVAGEAWTLILDWLIDRLAKTRYAGYNELFPTATMELKEHAIAPRPSVVRWMEGFVEDDEEWIVVLTEPLMSGPILKRALPRFGKDDGELELHVAARLRRRGSDCMVVQSICISLPGNGKAGKKMMENILSCFCDKLSDE